ncbi:zinc-binding dehydrogenase [Streptomyces sp. BK340]|uniref:quinone oxidoreductase family protein n=1 Tax=Streptomyces sp. BK340 TaxID=2572903 RepID=UPI0011A2193A|nr:zinc-binding dehydrogenase [Streptomyces sp. BK340]TVZ78001.1 NADPH2:quinone reductase [Streptomyces sp. BK340]
MLAYGFKSNGGPEVLEEIQVPTPAPGPGQVLIEVAYAGVNFAEVQHRRGEFGEPDGPGGYDVPGLEVSGTVAALGPGTAGPAVGEQVAAYLPAFGGYAEFAVAGTDFVRPVGALPLASAAGVPCVYPTAYGVLEDAGRLRAGETVLIHAAAGGVGSAAARIARALGAAHVFGTVGSAEKTGLAAGLGYDALFAREDFVDAVLEVTAGRGADLVLDPVGGAVRRASLTVLAPFGRVVTYGDLGRHGDWTADVWDLWKNSRSIAGYNMGDVARRSPAVIGEHLAQALSALASGTLPHTPPTVVPPAEVAEVHRRLEAGGTQGKTVFDIARRG